MHPTYARMLCITLRDMGVDVEAALRGAGTLTWADLATSETPMDQATINRLIAAALKASARPWLGLDVGAAVQASAHGPLGTAAVASRNLAQAVDTVARFGGVRYASVQFRVVNQPQGAVLLMHELVDLAESRTFVACMVFATLLRMMEAVVGHRLNRLTVEFPFPEPTWRAEIERLCAGHMLFARPHLAFHLDHEAMLSPCVTADRTTHSAACLQCEQLVHHTTQVTLRHQVAEMMGLREGAYPTLGEVARHLACSERTLMRRLKAEGSSYQALLDEARFQRAQWYLAHSALSIEDIAGRLGFADTSNFSRTFRRWSGRLPSEFRQISV